MWIGFQTHCIPTESLWKSPQNPHTNRTRKSSIPIPHTICLFVRCILNKHIYPVHVACYCVCSITIMKKKCCKTNKKLDCIWRNSNSDYDIYRVFNAFPLNLTYIPKNLHRIFTGPGDSLRSHNHLTWNLNTHGNAKHCFHFLICSLVLLYSTVGLFHL